MLYFLITQISGFWILHIFSAVWSDPQGLKREVAGLLNKAAPCQWLACCLLAFIQAKAKFIFYGAYPNEDLWRVNLTYALGGNACLGDD